MRMYLFEVFKDSISATVVNEDRFFLLLDGVIAVIALVCDCLIVGHRNGGVAPRNRAVIDSDRTTRGGSIIA